MRVLRFSIPLILATLLMSIFSGCTTSDPITPSGDLGRVQVSADNTTVTYIPSGSVAGRLQEGGVYAKFTCVDTPTRTISGVWLNHSVFTGNWTLNIAPGSSSFQFVPNGAYVGAYDMIVYAVVDGVEHPVDSTVRVNLNITVPISPTGDGPPPPPFS